LAAYQEVLELPIRRGAGTPALRAESLHLAPFLLEAHRRAQRHGSATLLLGGVQLLLRAGQYAWNRGKRAEAELRFAQARSALVSGIRLSLAGGEETLALDCAMHFAEWFLPSLDSRCGERWALSVARDLRSELTRSAAHSRRVNPNRAVRLELACARMDYGLSVRDVGVGVEVVLLEAETAVREASALAPSASGDALRGEALATAGTFYGLAGAPHIAADFLSRSLQYLPETELTRFRALASLAECEVATGHLDSAEQHALRALDLVERLGSEVKGLRGWDEHVPYSSLLAIALARGDLARADSAAEKASSRSNPAWARYFNFRRAQIGIVQGRRSGEISRWLDDAITAPAGGDALIQQWSCAARAERARLTRDTRGEERALRAAVAVCLVRQAPEEEAGFHLRLGHLYRAEGRLSEARAQFEAVLSHAEGEGAEALLWQGYFGLGRLAEATGNVKPALQLYRRAREIGERLRDRAGGAPETESRTLPELADVYGRAAWLASQRQGIAAAWQWAQAYHAQFLEKQLYGITGNQESGAAELRSRSGGAQAVRSARLKLGRLELARLNSPHARAGTKLRNAIEGAARRVYAEEAALRRRLGRLESVKPSAEAAVARRTLPELRELARREGCALVDYLLTDERLLIFTITGAAASVDVVTVGRDRLRRLAVTAADACSPFAPVRDYSAQEELYRLLIQPISRRVQPGQPLIVVPDGPLHQVPWPALVNPAPIDWRGVGLKLPRRHFLLYDRAVGLAPSLDVLAWSCEGAATAKALVCGRSYVSAAKEHERLVGPQAARLSPLGRAAEEEARGVAVLLDAPLHLNGEATRSVFLQGLSFGACWFVGHTFYDGEPARSALVLSRAGGDDRLTVPELLTAFPKPLPDLQLVTISACDSAAGPVATAEGPLSLAWALQRAGARSVVACRWKVENRATALLMTTFARNLRKGMGRLEALRQAQLDVCAAGFGPPQFWAAPVLYGRPGPLTIVPSENPQQALARSAAIALPALIGLAAFLIRFCKRWRREPAP
jgi:CHAT domain-containing protein